MSCVVAAQGTHVTGKVIFQLRTILVLELYVLLDPSLDDMCQTATSMFCTCYR
jgi:hypothetical protein